MLLTHRFKKETNVLTHKHKEKMRKTLEALKIEYSWHDEGGEFETLILERNQPLDGDQILHLGIVLGMAACTD